MECLYSRKVDGVVRHYCQRWDLPETEVRLVAGRFIEIDAPESFTATGPARFASQMELRSDFPQRIAAFVVDNLARSKRRQTENMLATQN